MTLYQSKYVTLNYCIITNAEVMSGRFKLRAIAIAIASLYIKHNSLQ